MKSLVVLVFVFALATAIDWDNVRPIEEKFLKNPEAYPLYAFMASQRGARIVGGDEARPGQFPYQVGMFIDSNFGQFFCGGSIIDEEWILTAAHCVDSIRNGVEVVVGAHNIRRDEDHQKIYVVSPENVIVHKDWDRVNAYNDIALLRPNRKINVTKYIDVIALPSKSQAEETFAGVTAEISGWGRFSDSSPETASILRWVEAETIANVKCRETYGLTIKPEHICVSGEKGKGSCGGDSGGPLTYEGVQIGVVSFGSSRGCEVGAPTVFTRMTRYLEWISDNTGIKIE